jgi:hypothetical protein
MANPLHIREHMGVLGSDGEHVGTVDSLEGDDMIKLARTDSPDGKHHYLAVDLVDRIDEQVHLSVTAEEAVAEWEDEDEDEEVSLDEETMSFGDTAEDEEDADIRAEERR